MWGSDFLCPLTVLMPRLMPVLTPVLMPRLMLKLDSLLMFRRRRMLMCVSLMIVVVGRVIRRR